MEDEWALDPFVDIGVLSGITGYCDIVNTSTQGQIQCCLTCKYTVVCNSWVVTALLVKMIDIHLLSEITQCTPQSASDQLITMIAQMVKAAGLYLECNNSWHTNNSVEGIIKCLKKFKVLNAWEKGRPAIMDSFIKLLLLWFTIKLIVKCNQQL